MASPPIATVTFRDNRLPDLAKRAPREISDILVGRGALATEARTKVNAPVDTGYLRNSVFTVGAVPGSLDARVAVGANYGPYPEFGTRRMPPQRYMGRATDQTFPDVVSALTDLERRLG